MEQVVVFRDFQEEQSEDFNNLQAYAQQTFDDLVNDAVTASIRYSGFNTAISGTAEVTAAPGRFYGPNVNGEIGAIFTLTAQSIISLVPYLAVSTQRYVTLAAYGVVDQIDQEARDFLTNVTTGQTEPQQVAMTASRDAVIAIIQGTEGPAPVPPAVPSTQVPFCNILLSNSNVISVTMLPAGLVTSTEDLNNRVGVIEAFDNAIEQQVSTLASDLAALALSIGDAGNDRALIIDLMQDVADIKTTINLPSTYSQYGASYFLFADGTQFDLTNSLSLGYSADIENGVRFPAQNANTFALSLFNPLDPLATYNSGTGLLLPAYESIVRLTTLNGAGDNTQGTVALGQYTYNTYTQEEITVPYSRIRSGGTYYQCTNGNSGWSANSTTDDGEPYWLPSFSSIEVQSGSNYDFYHGVQYTDYLWIDTWTEDYWTLEATSNSIEGALIAQTMLVSSDTWFNGIKIFISTVASATDINFAIALTTSNGEPDMTSVIASGTMAGADLIVGTNNLLLAPFFVSNGTRVAIVISTMANHQVYLIEPGYYLDGTFFYSLDGTYFLGDLTKTLAITLLGCEFDNASSSINLGSLNLEGGIRAIDLCARMTVPSACTLTFEVLPEGSSTWLPISAENPLAPFQGAPVLCQFRATFVGTADIQPGVVLTDSLCKIWCPGPTYKLVTLAETLQAPSKNITIKYTVENFNPTPHTISPYIWVETPASATVVFTTNPANSTTLTIDGVAVTFVTSGATGNQVNIGGSLAATLVSLLALLQGSTNTTLDQMLYSLNTGTNTLTVTWGTAGAGNGTTLATTVSGATVSGALAGASTALQKQTPAAVSTTLTNTSIGQYDVVATFTGIPLTSSFVIECDGTTNSVADVYLISNMVWYAQ